MTSDERSRDESVPYVLTDDEIVDDMYDFESYQPRYASPAAKRRGLTEPSRRNSAQKNGSNTVRSRVTASNLIAFAIAMGLGFWAVTSGVFVSDAGSQGGGGAGKIAAMAVEEPPPFPVTVQASEAVRHDQVLTVRGRTEAGARVAVKTETAGVVESIVARKGTPVARGDVLCALQRDARDAALSEAKAQLARARLDNDASTQLAEGGTTTKLALAGSKATLDAAEAAMKKAEIELSRTQVSAPFAGIVEEQPAKLGEFLNVGSTCAVLISPDPLFVVGAVTERQVGSLRTGMEGSAQLVTGERVSGAIRFVGSAAEQNTRTFRVELEVPNPDGRLRDGVTATMRIPIQGEVAHRLPSSALTLNDAGQLGVRIIERGDMAQFRPVKVLSDERSGVWVAGLPREINVIVAGQDFVTDGQRVRPVDRRATPRQ